jgi:hypothetical protein
MNEQNKAKALLAAAMALGVASPLDALRAYNKLHKKCQCGRSLYSGREMATGVCATCKANCKFL